MSKKSLHCQVKGLQIFLTANDLIFTGIYDRLFSYFGVYAKIIHCEPVCCLKIVK